jgi:hypothetical protein
LIEAVIDEDPRELGYHSTVWTAALLIHHLQRVHGIEVSRKSVSAALARLAIRTNPAAGSSTGRSTS